MNFMNSKKMNLIQMNFDRIKNAFFIFISILLSLYFIKPNWLFEEHSGKRREFGVGFNRDGERKTLFDMTIIVIIVSILASIF